MIKVKGKKPGIRRRTAVPQMPRDVVATSSTHASEAIEDSPTVIPSSIDTIATSSRVTWEYYLA